MILMVLAVLRVLKSMVSLGGGSRFEPAPSTDTSLIRRRPHDVAHALAAPQLLLDQASVLVERRGESAGHRRGGLGVGVAGGFLPPTTPPAIGRLSMRPVTDRIFVVLFAVVLAMAKGRFLSLVLLWLLLPTWRGPWRRRRG